MTTSSPSDVRAIFGLDTSRVLRRLCYWLGYDMREHGEEWAAVIDILGYCRLAIYDVTATDGQTLDLQETALTSHVVRAYRHRGFNTQRCGVDFIGTRADDTLYYLPALQQVIRAMYRRGS